jgi:hypothetical protein
MLLPDNHKHDGEEPRTKLRYKARARSRVVPEGEDKKHHRVIIGIIDGWAYLAPIMTDETGMEACPLKPRDMPVGLLNRPSFLNFDHVSTRLLDELQREVPSDKVRTCPPVTWDRIQATLQDPKTDLPDWVRRQLQPAPPVRTPLRDLRERLE